MLVLLVDQGRAERVARQHAPTWGLAIVVMTGGPLGARMQAESSCRIAMIEPEEFRRLAYAHPPVTQRVMRQIAPVMSRITEIEQHRERLAALGTMAAGLAHELNNPAAAARRAAAQMADTLDVVGGADRRVVDAGPQRGEGPKLVG